MLKLKEWKHCTVIFYNYTYKHEALFLNGSILKVKDLLMFLLIVYIIIPLHISIKHEETSKDSTEYI
jgi:hypothetical protein